MAINIETERLLVSELQEKITKNHFIPLAEAARQAKLPLTTLAAAVRNGWVPAIQVQPQRWVVRLEAVRLYFKPQVEVGTHRSQEAIDHFLMEKGIIAKRNLPFEKPVVCQPVDFEHGPTGSELVIEGRRRLVL
jgi:hypothetical protein